MSKNVLRAVSTSTVRVAVGEDSIQPEAGDTFVSSPYVDQVTQRALAIWSPGIPSIFRE